MTRNGGKTLEELDKLIALLITRRKVLDKQREAALAKPGRRRMAREIKELTDDTDAVLQSDTASTNR